MAVNIRKPARARLWKRVAIILASVSTLALVVFVVISFLPHGNDAFSIRIHNPGRQSESGEENHFHMSRGWSSDGSKDKDEGEYLRGESLDKMVLTTAEDVEKHLAEIKDKEGQQNFYVKTEEEELKGYALVYTVYLVNDSATQDQNLKFSVNADTYYDSTTGNSSIIDYLRILIQTEVVGSNEVNNVYYGQKHNNPKVNLPTGEGDREPISTYKRSFDATKIEAKYTTKYKGEDVGYCYNFNELNETNKALVNDNTTQVTIPKGGVLRFTYVSYFEGEDMDSNVTIPSDSYILLSLHFGL